MTTHRPPTADYHPEGTPDVPEEHSATHHVSLRTYLWVFGALMVLLVLTVVAAFKIHIGHHGNILLALFIAIVKAALVVLFFMHVKYASRLTKIFVVAGFVWLAIMFGLTFSDYFTRGWLPQSRGWVDQTADHNGHAPAQAPAPGGVRPGH
jgi:cytochrome c oxidase subunit 4